jgi:2-keto-4-pentenoate hydratase/2-oxohepta-3-ene-1,7-dioic acid hydratase in catechol pathway
MRLYTFEVATAVGKFRRIGAGLEEKMIDLNLACAAYLATTGEPDPYAYASFLIPPDMITYLERGDRSRKAADETLFFVRDRLKAKGKVEGPNNEQIVYEPDSVRLLAPVPRPNVLRDCTVFLEHVKAMSGTVPEIFFRYPCYLTQNGATVAGPRDPIYMPRYTQKLDFEMELGIYVGKKGINIPEDQAGEYIAGVTIYNDVSARDAQMEEQGLPLGPGKGKNFEHANIMGPCLVTPDEIDYNNVSMTVRVNGELVGTDNSKDMYHKFPKIISHISQEEYLYPGDFIASGTSPHGTTHCSSLKRWLQVGDVVEMEFEGIGIIRNEVMAGRT